MFSNILHSVDQKKKANAFCSLLELAAPNFSALGEPPALRVGLYHSVSLSRAPCAMESSGLKPVGVQQHEPNWGGCG